jgi:dGTPase
VGQRFLDRTQPSLEAQLANLADEVAYNNHDIDDGLRSGLITLEQLKEVSIFERHHAHVLESYPGLAARRAVAETIRRMINTLIVDLTRTSLARIREFAPATADDVRRAPPLATFSPEIRSEADALKKFLFDNLYRHYRVLRMTTKARRIVRELFAAFLDDPRLLPPDYRRPAFNEQARAIADYIAGMTDRYAIREHKRLFEMA